MCGGETLVIKLDSQRLTDCVRLSMAKLNPAYKNLFDKESPRRNLLLYTQ